MPRQQNKHHPKKIASSRQPHSSLFRSLGSRRSSSVAQRGQVKLVPWLIVCAWIGILFVIGANRQNLIDQWKLHGYTPSPAIAKLAAEDTLTDYGRKILYVNRPSIQNKATFASVCPNNGGEQTIVLGCYHSNQAGIYLLSVSDPRLSGVNEVTAAHEMLHGAYDRLNAKERARVDKMLTDYYAHDLKDPRILATIDAYKKTEPHDVVNEMHSVFGSEVASLPSNLETYYKQYFSDRSKVITFASQYQTEFSSRQATVAQDDAQLTQLKTQIDSTEADVKAKQDEISSRQNTLVKLRASGDTAGYNEGVPGYNQLVRDYNAEVQSLQDMVDQYNQLVAARNAVAGEIDQLTKDLRTDASPIQS